MDDMSETVYQQIKELYLQQITVPDTKPAIQYVLCPIGLVGAGKTTVVKPLSEKLDLVRISGDEIRKLFKERGCSYTKVHDLATLLTNHFLTNGYSICIDSDCAGKIEEIKKVAKKHHVPIIWIHINPPESFIIDKLSNLKSNWLGTAEEMVANYYQRKPVHKNINLDFAVVFDTSRPDIAEQIESSVLVIKHAVGI